MIGTTLKVGYDGTAVTRGLNSMRGKIGRALNRATRQVAIGGARAIGNSIFGTITQAIAAIPNELGRLSDLNKEMEALGMSTKVASENYLALRQSIAKVTGKDASEAGALLKDMSERLGEAMTDPDSTPRKALHQMGLTAESITGKSVANQIKIISDAYKKMVETKGTEKSMFTINELLGEIGKEMVPLFLNYSSIMKESRGETLGMSKDMKMLRHELIEIDRIKLALGNKMSELSLGVLKALQASGMTSGSLSKWIQSFDISGISSDLANIIEKAGAAIRKLLLDISSGELTITEAFKRIFQTIGKYIGEGIKDAFKIDMNGIIGSLIKPNKILDKIIPGLGSGLPTKGDGNGSGIEMKMPKIDLEGIKGMMKDAIRVNGHVLPSLGSMMPNNTNQKGVENLLSQQTLILKQIANKTGIAIAI